MESLGHVYMDEEAYKLQLLFARVTQTSTLVFSCFPTSACVPQHVSRPLPQACNRRLELLHLRAVDLSLSIYSLFGKSFALFPVLFRGIRGSSGLVEARRGDLIPFCGFAGAI
ncbi:hypothetical protein MRB53_002723 [Persea americana]|uniref:Uncharacterized protein n=1 Tax=Persea americana TaxID=3435 RepID=A0ACC2MWA1_PERAE|nr:hypothetical protein MRB53_002723 [Persea americana]